MSDVLTAEQKEEQERQEAERKQMLEKLEKRCIVEDGPRYFFQIPGGEKLELRHASSLYLTRWVQAYKRKNPQPKPPYYEHKQGNSSLMLENKNDAGYQHELQAWNDEYEIEQMLQFYRMGIKSEPPDDYEPSDLVVELGATGERKLDWITDVTMAGEEATLLLAAINALIFPDNDEVWRIQESFKS